MRHLCIDPEQALEGSRRIQEQRAIVCRVRRDKVVGLLHQHPVCPQLRHLQYEYNIS